MLTVTPHFTLMKLMRAEVMGCFRLSFVALLLVHSVDSYMRRKKMSSHVWLKSVLLPTTHDISSLRQ